MVGSDQRHTEQFGAMPFHAMATTEEQNPPKRPKVSHEEEAVIDLEDSEDGNLQEDVELENQLRNVQADLDEIHEEMLSKLREVEREYERKKAPLYSARGEVIKNIPGFWLHCFMQHQEIRHIIDDVDEEILSSLVEISVEAHKDAKDGYKLAFRFADNVYFDAEVLVKQINFVTDTDSGLQTCHTTGSKPKWKQQDPTKTEEGAKETDTAPFISWLVSERTLEEGLVDTLADIIKDQLYVNPLEYLEADHGFEGEEEEEEELIAEGEEASPFGEGDPEGDLEEVAIEGGEDEELLDPEGEEYEQNPGVEDAEEDDDLNAELEGDEELDENLAGEDDAGDEEDDGKEEPADVVS